LPVSPSLAPTITATNGGIISANIDKSAISKLGARCRKAKPKKDVSGELIIGENRVDTTKRISSSGNPGGGVIKIETTRKTAFNPK
jgi:hypothetical protein